MFNVLVSSRHERKAMNEDTEHEGTRGTRLKNSRGNDRLSRGEEFIDDPTADHHSS